MMNEFVETVRKGYVMVDGRELRGLQRNISSMNSLEVTAATNGYCGGDTGHGSRTFVQFRDLSGTDIKGLVAKDHIENSMIRILLGGDSELYTFIEALRFAADSLEALAEEAGGLEEKAC